MYVFMEQPLAEKEENNIFISFMLIDALYCKIVLALCSYILFKLKKKNFSRFLALFVKLFR